MEKLTAIESEALAFIRRYFAEHGYSPTVREVAKAINRKSSSNGFTVVNALEEKGYLRRKSKSPRSISLTFTDGATVDEYRTAIKVLKNEEKQRESEKEKVILRLAIELLEKGR